MQQEISKIQYCEAGGIVPRSATRHILQCVNVVNMHVTYTHVCIVQVIYVYVIFTVVYNM